MTQREFLNAVVKANISEEVNTAAAKYLAAIDKRNATPTKAELAKRAENEAIKAEIVKVLADGAVRVASDIGARVGVSTAKASSLLRQMGEAGQVTISEVKVKNSGKVKGYAIASGDDTNGEPQALPSELEV